MDPDQRFRGGGGMARAVVDGMGRLVGLEVEPELLRRSSAQVAQAILAAVIEAQDQVPPAGPPVEESQVDTSQLAVMVEEAEMAAERRQAQFADLVAELARATEYRR